MTPSATNRRDALRARALDASADAILIVDAGGQIVDANLSAGVLCGRDHAALPGTALGELIDAEPAALATPGASGASGARWMGEIIVRHADGTRVVRRGTTDAFVDDEGRVWRQVAIRAARGRDHVRQALRAQSLETLGALAAGIAHEINTPTQYISDNLGFLLGATEQLGALATAGDAARAAARAEIAYLVSEMPLAVQQSREGLAQVSVVVDALRLLASRASVDAVPVDLNAELEAVLAISRHEWKYVATVTRDLDAALPPIRCRGGVLRQIVLRLVLDAAHAIARGPRVTGQETGVIGVRTWIDADRLLLSVADSALYRMASPDSLALEREVLASEHGGTIDVDWVRGRGTTVTVCLPRAVAP